MPLSAGPGRGGYCPFVPAGGITPVSPALTMHPPPGKGRTNLLPTNVRGSQLITNLIKANGGKRERGRGGRSVGGERKRGRRKEEERDAVK